MSDFCPVCGADDQACGPGTAHDVISGEVAPVDAAALVVQQQLRRTILPGEGYRKKRATLLRDKRRKSAPNTKRR